MGLRFFNLIKKRSLTFLMWRAKHLIRINAVTLFAILAGGGGMSLVCHNVSKYRLDI